MSTLEQVRDNIRTYQELEPISAEESRWLAEDVNALYRAQGPVKDLSRYEGLSLYGVPVTAIMEGYSVCQLQPDPGFADDNNYLLNAVAEEYRRDFTEDLPKVELVNNAGEDVTEEVYQAYNWLREHTF